jgi:thiamine transport system substrate-binding protein
LQELNEKIFTITSGWSSSYGLFQKGQAKAVFSYVTSPIYHQIEERDNSYKALAFEEGLPVHIEFAGLLKTCSQCELGEQFIQFLLSPKAQAVLMKKNYMLPVVRSVAAQTPWDLVDNFKTLTMPKFTKIEKQRIIERWTRWTRER